MEPKIINRSSQPQKLKIYFNADASPLSGKIILTNFYYDINKQIECKVSTQNKKIIICEGIYNFTGEFFFKDINDYSLTNKFLRVVPKKGEKYNINNLVEEKIIFDYSELDKSIYLSKDLFKEANNNSKLIIETTDLNFNPTYKNLNLFKGKSNSIIKFNSKAVNTTVNKNGSIIVPAGRELIVIDIKDYLDIFKNEGLTVKGIGFGLNSIYLNEKIDISDDTQKYEENEGGISGWVIFLIIIIAILVIGLGFYLFFHFRTKSIESEIDSTFEKKEKMMN
jgi:heme/copper-type cytochrome/quinol oxidase subunit 2